MPVTCVFDAYGTLFDVTAAARQVAEAEGGEALADLWPTLAADWRERQLAYTWLRSLAGAHADFWQVTGEALDWALERHGLDDAGLRDRLMALYRDLPAFPEVPDMLGALKDGDHPTGILSNGSPEMLSSAVASAGIARLLDHVLSVESVGTFKPAPAVYDMVGRAFDVGKGDVLFVSSNGWDAAAARGYGFRSVWVNRGGLPMDRLPWSPDHVLPDLTGLPELAGSL